MSRRIVLQSCSTPTYCNTQGVPALIVKQIMIPSDHHLIVLSFLGTRPRHSPPHSAVIELERLRPLAVSHVFPLLSRRAFSGRHGAYQVIFFPPRNDGVSVMVNYCSWSLCSTERDAFDTLFDHAPDKLNVVKKVRGGRHRDNRVK